MADRFVELLFLQLFTEDGKKKKIAKYYLTIFCFFARTPREEK